MHRISFYRRIGLLLLLALLTALTSGCNPEAGRGDLQTLPFTGDIIVVGSGMAGLTAALEAARQGASVILCDDLLQDDKWMWEDGVLATGEGTAGGSLEGALISSGNGEGKIWHYEILARHADEALAWLSGEVGLNPEPGGAFRFLPGNVSYSEAQRRLLDRARDEGVRFVEGALPQELIIDDQGAAAGITLLDSTGVYHRAFAPAIILADGGYLNDLELLQELAPKTVVVSSRCGGESNAIKLARSAGLDLVKVKRFAYVPAVEGGHGWTVAEPPPGALLIVDERIYPLAQLEGSAAVGLILNSAAGEGYLLAAEAALPPDTDLKWPRYDGVGAFMESFQLQIPSLPRWFSRPHGHFYGCPVKAAAFYCLGGIAVDEFGTALREGRPVEGLYAIGETAGDLNGSTLLPGTALTEALVWGRYVAETAVRRVQE